MKRCASRLEANGTAFVRRPASRLYGHRKGLHVKEQLMRPTSHCAIRRASPILQLPSLLTSHRSGWVNGDCPHDRRATSSCATIRASPTSTTPSPFTSPHVVGWIVVVVVVCGTVVVVAVVEVVVGGGTVLVVVVTWENPWIWMMLLKTEESPSKVETNMSLFRGSNSRPKGPAVVSEPKPLAKRMSTGFAVPSVGSPVVPSTARPVAGSMVTMWSSPALKATYIRSPANGADGMYCMFARLPFASVAKSVFATGAKKPPLAGVSASSYTFLPNPVLICSVPKAVPGSTRNGEKARPAIDEGTLSEFRLSCISFAPTRSASTFAGK